MTPNLKTLRGIVERRSRGYCEWSRCQSFGEQLAHIRGKGMGGRPSADQLDNLALLCVRHHDLLDGREHAGLRVAVAELLAQVIELKGYVGKLLAKKLVLHIDPDSGLPQCGDGANIEVNWTIQGEL